MMMMMMMLIMMMMMMMIVNKCWDEETSTFASLSGWTDEDEMKEKWISVDEADAGEPDTTAAAGDDELVGEAWCSERRGGSTVLSQLSHHQHLSSQQNIFTIK